MPHYLSLKAASSAALLWPLYPRQLCRYTLIFVITQDRRSEGSRTRELQLELVAGLLQLGATCALPTPPGWWSGFVAVRVSVPELVQICAVAAPRRLVCERLLFPNDHWRGAGSPRQKIGPFDLAHISN